MTREVRVLQAVQFGNREGLQDVVRWDFQDGSSSIQMNLRDRDTGAPRPWWIGEIVHLKVLPPRRKKGTTYLPWYDSTPPDALAELFGVLDDQPVHGARAGLDSYSRGRTFVLRHPQFVLVAHAGRAGQGFISL